MRVFILGVDGYIGWPLAQYLKAAGHTVAGWDNLQKRYMAHLDGSCPAVDIASFGQRKKAGFDIAKHDASRPDTLTAKLARWKPDAVLNLAQIPSAPYSMRSALACIRTHVNNCSVVLSVLWALKEAAPDAHLVHIGTLGEYGTPSCPIPEGWFEYEGDRMVFPRRPASFYHSCYDAETEVLTGRGWLPFPELREDDEVFCRDLSSPVARYERPTAIVTHDYNGMMYRLRGRRLDLLVTPNHRMMTCTLLSEKGKPKAEKRARFQLAREIYHSVNAYSTVVEWTSKDEIERFMLPACIYNASASRKEKVVEAKSIPGDLWLEFFGWFLAEGHARQYYTSITQKDGPVADRIGALCRAVAEHIGANTGTHTNTKGIVDWRIHSKQLCEYLRDFGLSVDHYVPRWVMNLSRRQIEMVLWPLVTGDGTKSGRGHTFYTISKRLADDVQEMALKCGWASTTSSVRRKKTTYNRTEYTVSVAPSRCIQVNQTTNGQINDTWQEYDGRVYCCEVPGDGVIMVRRNGRPMWCGNSKVASTYDIEAACRFWGLRATDVMQGPVYGLRFDGKLDGKVGETALWVDETWATVLNRFCAQAVLGHPLTVYGGGGQTRGLLPLADSLQCLRLLLEHPAEPGEYRCVNQFDRAYSIVDLAEMVRREATEVGLPDAHIHHYENPRVEAEKHFYAPVCDTLPRLGYKPQEDLAGEVRHVLEQLSIHRDRLESIRHLLPPKTLWR